MIRYTIKELPVLERPYEKLEMYGEKSLSNSELLAIILKTGNKEETALQLAQRVINECCGGENNFSLKNVSLDMLRNIKGIGRVKAITLKAAFELANRFGTNVTSKPFLLSSNAAGEYLIKVFSNEKQEKLRVLGLNTRGELERDIIASVGGLNAVGITVSDIFRVPIECGCKNIIIAHNHPSGEPTPSDEDIETTKKVYVAGRLLGIELLDHIVVGKNSFASIRQLNGFKW